LCWAAAQPEWVSGVFSFCSVLCRISGFVDQYAVTTLRPCKRYGPVKFRNCCTAAVRSAGRQMPGPGLCSNRRLFGDTIISGAQTCPMNVERQNWNHGQKFGGLEKTRPFREIPVRHKGRGQNGIENCRRRASKIIRSETM